MKSVAIVGTIGYGRTQRSSIDAALRGCGLDRAVLVPVLSAVIPPGAEIAVWDMLPSRSIASGSRLPVLAAMRTTTSGEGGIAAAIGWYACRDGCRVIAAHDTASDDPVLAELDALTAVYASLRDMVEGRGEPFDGLRVEVQAISAPAASDSVTVAMLAILDVFESRPALARAPSMVASLFALNPWSTPDEASVSPV